MSNQIWLGLSGAARSGKSTVANYLYHERFFAVMAFADPIKQLAKVLFPHWRSHELEGPGKDVVEEESGILPRAVFQELGAGLRRVDSDFWVKQAETRIRYGFSGCLRKVCWSDVRYENEAAWVRSKGGIILRIVRDGTPEVRGHESEHGISYYDEVITNNGTRDELFQRVDDVLRSKQ